jgi:uncharacterized protein YuzE
LEGGIVRADYDPKTDTLSLVLQESMAVAESDETKPSVILDYDERGDLVSMEILNASRGVNDTRKMEFSVAGYYGDFHVCARRHQRERGALGPLIERRLRWAVA